MIGQTSRLSRRSLTLRPFAGMVKIRADDSVSFNL